MGLFRKKTLPADKLEGPLQEVEKNLQQRPGPSGPTREASVAQSTRARDPSQANAWLQLGISAQERGDIGQAIEWYQKAAGAGNRDAMFNLGNLYAGLGKTDESLWWYLRAADAGDDDAMLNIAVHHFRSGADDEAIQWYLRAQAAGNRDAGAPLELLQRMQDGEADAAFQLGSIHMQQGNQEETIRCWIRAHEAGHHEAAYDLGVIFQQRGDRERALHWFTVSADTGYSDALTGLMQLMPMDELLKWLKAAIDRGNSVARDFLAQIREGDGSEIHDQKHGSESATGGSTAMTTIEEWEEWIDQRLDAELKRDRESLDAPVGVATETAEANLLLIELLAEMTTRSSLSKFYSFVSDADSSPEGNLRLRIVSDVMWAVKDRDDGASSGSRAKAVTAADAAEVPRAAGLLFIFLHALAAPNGVPALSRATQLLDESTEGSASAEHRALRARLYIALVDMLSLENALPPLPAEVLTDFR